MGLFVLTSSDSVIDRLKAALENLKLEERLQKTLEINVTLVSQFFKYL